ncbi:MAG TPA: DUF1003 domain-containing protein [Actinomycetota bacterium]|nr:DUF1003 domain-containing protein [Actinomycetota bacterium]
MSIGTMAPPTHPALRRHAEMRRASIQNRIADAVTKFAGSMVFVYVHIVWFVLWIGFRVEKFPFGLLTMMVSLEAIFLSTFLLISQNRQDERRQLLADAEWKLVQEQQNENELEVKQNEELLDLSRQILELTRQIHGLSQRGGSPERPG